MPTTIKLTAIRPRGPENIWYINGDSLADVPFARLLDPGLPYKIVSALTYATYHGRDGVVAREIEFQLKPLVSEWHSAILWNATRCKIERIRIGWADYDPGDTHYLMRIGWNENPELLKGILRYNLSTAYWDKFLNNHVIDSPFHSDFENWQLMKYSPTLWQKAINLAQAVNEIQKELEELFYGD